MPQDLNWNNMLIIWFRIKSSIITYRTPNFWAHPLKSWQHIKASYNFCLFFFVKKIKIISFIPHTRIKKKKKEYFVPHTRSLCSVCSFLRRVVNVPFFYATYLVILRLSYVEWRNNRLFKHNESFIHPLLDKVKLHSFWWIYYSC